MNVAPARGLTMGHIWSHREACVARAAEPPVPPLRGGTPKFRGALPLR